MSGARKALIIAQDVYDDPGLTELRSPAQDALALAEVLRDPDVGAFDVAVVQNEPSPVVAHRVEEFFAEGRREDALLVHFSCHGLKNLSGELFFAARDTVPRLVRSTAVSAYFVRKCMSVCRARNTVLLLDCCFGGAFLEGMGLRSAGDAHVLDSFSAQEMGSGRGWAVVTASNAIEYAFEGDRLAQDAPHAPSVFTSALVSGLSTGEADLNEDGRVSLDELYDYLYDRIRSENPHQTPSCSVHMQGDVYLARSDRRHHALNQLSEPLRRALLSSDQSAQQWGVVQLEAAVTGADIVAAAAAHAALFWLTRQPSHPAGAAAHRILEAALITPVPAALDLGCIAQGAPSPSRLLHLVGPPLALDCKARPRTDAVGVQRMPETGDLVITLSTSNAGPVESSIVLSSPLGDVDVPVTAEVLPASPPEAERSEAPGPVAQEWRSATAPPLADARIDGRGDRPHPKMRRRVLARLIDLVLVFIVGWALLIAALLLAESSGVGITEDSAFFNAWMLLAIFGWGLLIFLYDALLLGRWASTIGMAAVGLRVVDASGGGRIRRRQAFIRAAVFGLPQSIPVLGQFFILIGYLASTPDGRNRPLEDVAASTLVGHAPWGRASD
ncbi:caspase, EACC1-associated type [Streptomonospora wellingtoniae]|uniref:RDD family protein n=1 Tax=Streptomonospora wellingtoniae TaxID=3075544 RepID=A0ABU2KYS6_9ACTN|nr:RDD family protein [Streptomonospora sp. DSM 45055]MDT0304297.1 RDD family protein [Streptomonospora sp. DSM 45055]